MQGVYDGFAPYVFISYSHKDSERVMPYVRSMQARGFRVWYDGGIEVGTEWPAYIEQRLENCACLMVFLSDNTIESVNCRNEINVATELKKEVLVAQLDETVTFQYGMRLQLSSRQKIFCFRHADADGLADELEKARILENCRGEVQTPPPTAPVAPVTPVAEKSRKKNGWNWANVFCLLACLGTVLSLVLTVNPEALLPASAMTLTAAIVAIFALRQTFWRILNTIAAAVSAALMALGMITHPTMVIEQMGGYAEAAAGALAIFCLYVVLFIISEIKRHKKQ